MNKKLVITLVSVALVGAVGVGSTLAYLTAKTEEVRNTFTVGNVSYDKKLANGILEHDIDPAEDAAGVNEYVLLDNDDAAIVAHDAEDANWEDNYTTKMEYTKLYPSQKIAKDPTVFLDEKSMDAYVFVKVEGANAPEYKDVVYNLGNDNTAGKNAWKWYKDDKSTGILWKVMTANENATVFTSVTLADDVDQIVESKGNKLTDIVLTSWAVQYKGMADEKEAFAQTAFAK